MTDFFEKEKTIGVNLTALPTACDTCGGDRFVVYQTRPVQQSTWMKEKGIKPPAGAEIEEYVPCPTCNATIEADYFLLGKKQRTPDPAQVRERLSL